MPWQSAGCLQLDRGRRVPAFAVEIAPQLLLCLRFLRRMARADVQTVGCNRLTMRITRVHACRRGQLLASQAATSANDEGRPPLPPCRCCTWIATTIMVANRLP